LQTKNGDDWGFGADGIVYDLFGKFQGQVLNREQYGGDANQFDLIGF
jgi:hypothetical protein